MALTTLPKPPAHHKKRIGKHHKTTKHYMKPYLPYLPLLAIVAVGFVISNFVNISGNVLGDQADISSGSLLTDTNIQRQAAGEAGLQLNSELMTAAQTKANDMVKRNYWAHNTPDGKQPWSFLTAAGYNYQLAGENLAYGFTSAEAVTTGWMNSPEHRANILKTDYRDIGFGIASSPDYNGTGPETVVVAMYGTVVQVAGNATNIEFSVPGHSDSNVLGANSTTDSRQIALVQLLTSGRAPWSVMLVSIITAVAATIFLLRHGRGWHRALKQSEAYIASHPWFDVFVVTLGTVGFILSRSVGFIR